jgi:hypothetical protein
MAGESEFTIVAEGDAPGGARWQVMAGGTAEDYLRSWSGRCQISTRAASPPTHNRNHCRPLILDGAMPQVLARRPGIRATCQP